uniref:DNA2/NAM7 helicase helicase domain-containing protein n=1 Tax=Globodera rostochiensis TaxID=31243 RepID=A0A914H4B8_GLORO
MECSKCHGTMTTGDRKNVKQLTEQWETDSPLSAKSDYATEAFAQRQVILQIDRDSVSRLNDEQKQTLALVACSQPLAIFQQAPPDTGKTLTLATAIELLTRSNGRKRSVGVDEECLAHDEDESGRPDKHGRQQRHRTFSEIRGERLSRCRVPGKE